MLNIRIIRAPRPGTMSMLFRRMTRESRKVENRKFDAMAYSNGSPKPILSSGYRPGRAVQARNNR